jgi:hypothetical protein
MLVTQAQSYFDALWGVTHSHLNYDGHRLTTRTQSGLLHSLTDTYAYDADGNVSQITRLEASNTIQLTYEWEPGTHHLRSALKTTNGSTNYSASFEYDRLNRIRKYCWNGNDCHVFSYIGASDWLSVVRNQYGTILQRYLYVNGKPLRMDDPSHYQNPSYYVRYNARGDAAAVVQKNGDGGTSWTNFGAWGDMNYNAIGYYGWNAAWGYMQFPVNLNFNMHDAQDMGLYFAHGRWYNQETGLWLSPNAKGDYLYGGDGQDPVNKGWLERVVGNEGNGSKKGTLHYLKTKSGYVDTSHFGSGQTQATRILAALEQNLTDIPLEESFGFGDLSGVQKGLSFFKAGVRINYHMLQPVNKVERTAVALGMFQDLEQRFEMFQLFMYDGNNSGFSIEDLPSDYLGFYSIATAKGLPEIVSILEGRQVTSLADYVIDKIPDTCSYFDFADAISGNPFGLQQLPVPKQSLDKAHRCWSMKNLEWRPKLLQPGGSFGNVNWPDAIQLPMPKKAGYWTMSSCHTFTEIAGAGIINPRTSLLDLERYVCAQF